MLTITLLLLIVYFYSYCKTNCVYSFSREKTGVLKAILPFFIILHHANSEVLLDFIPAGKFVVAFFFCISGYGMESKFLGLGQFTFSDLKHRLMTILLPTIVPMLIYIFVLLFKNKNIWDVIYGHFCDFSLPLPNTWFVVILATIYFFFFLASSSLKRSFTLFALVLVLNLILLVLFRDKTHLYASNFAFVMGCIFKLKERYVISALKYGLFKKMLPILLVISYSLISNKPFAIFNICIYSFSAMMIIYMIPMTNTNNGIMNFLKKISYENYLCHGIVMIIVSSSMFSSFVWYLLTIIVCTILISTISNFFTGQLQKLFYL